MRHEQEFPFGINPNDVSREFKKKVARFKKQFFPPTPPRRTRAFTERGFQHPTTSSDNSAAPQRIPITPSETSLTPQQEKRQEPEKISWESLVPENLSRRETTLLEIYGKIYNKTTGLKRLMEEGHRNLYWSGQEVIIFGVKISHNFDITPESIAAANKVIETIYKDLQRNPQTLAAADAIRKNINASYGVIEDTLTPQQLDHMWEIS